MVTEKQFSWRKRNPVNPAFAGGGGALNAPTFSAEL